jgi:hypothetical protein
MHLGASSPQPITVPSVSSNAQAAGQDATAAADPLAQAISGYYSHLNAKTPIYQSLSPAQPSVVGTPEERDIQEQLGALVDKIKSLLAQGRGTSHEPELARLDHFLGNIQHRGQTGKLSTEEVQYFYSRSFKGKLERDVALADAAAPDGRDAATQRLEALCRVLGAPAMLYNHVVASRIVREFTDDFCANLDPSVYHPSQASPSSSRGWPEGASRI